MEKIDEIAYSLYIKYVKDYNEKNKEKDYNKMMDVFSEKTFMFSKYLSHEQFSSYYEKAKIELRKLKIKNINENSINNRR